MNYEIVIVPKVRTVRDDEAERVKDLAHKLAMSDLEDMKKQIERHVDNVQSVEIRILKSCEEVRNDQSSN